jgi:nicotinate-nucleotide adenylyltransferase
MTELAIKDNPFFELSALECQSPGPSYTVETLRRMRDLYRGDTLCLLLGLDAFLELPHWHRPRQLLALPDEVAVLARPGYSFLSLLESPFLESTPSRDALWGLQEGRLRRLELSLKGGRPLVALVITALDISATRIRALIRQHGSTRYLLPPEVQSYIISNKLYL